MAHIPKLLIFWEEEFVKGKIFALHRQLWKDIVNSPYFKENVRALHWQSHPKKTETDYVRTYDARELW